MGLARLNWNNMWRKISNKYCGVVDSIQHSADDAWLTAMLEKHTDHHLQWDASEAERQCLTLGHHKTQSDSDDHLIAPPRPADLTWLLAAKPPVSTAFNTEELTKSRSKKQSTNSLQQLHTSSQKKCALIKHVFHKIPEKLLSLQQQPQPLFYSHYTGRLVLAETSS